MRTPNKSDAIFAISVIVCSAAGILVAEKYPQVCAASILVLMAALVITIQYGGKRKRKNDE